MSIGFTKVFREIYLYFCGAVNVHYSGTISAPVPAMDRMPGMAARFDLLLSAWLPDVHGIPCRWGIGGPGRGRARCLSSEKIKKTKMAKKEAIRRMPCGPLPRFKPVSWRWLNAYIGVCTGMEINPLTCLPTIYIC